MGFKGIGKAIEKGIPLAAVMRLLFTEQLQAPPNAQLIQPAAPPGSVVENAMEVGASGDASLVSAAGHPTQRWVLAEVAAGFECMRVAAMKLESLHAECGLVFRPVHAALPVAQGFLTTEACAQGQESEAGHGAVAAGGSLAFQAVWILQFLAEHLHAAADAEDGTA